MANEKELLKRLEGLLALKGVSITEHLIDLEVLFDEYKVEKKVKTDHLKTMNVIDGFIQSKKLDGVSDSCLRQYYYNIRKFSRIIDKKISEINPNDMRDYTSLRLENVKSNTVASNIECMRSFFTWCTLEGYTMNNPMSRIKRLRHEKEQRKSLTRTQIEKLRSACTDNRERCYIEMFLSTGCRISELHNAKLSSINDREILVIGKGKKERKVFITDVALHYLNIYVSKRKFESEYIFSQKYSGKALGMRAMHKVIQDVSERSNVRAFTHILRHSMATFLVSSGCPLYSIQEMLGHTDPKTTTIYAKNNSEMVKLEHLKYCNV